MKAEKDMLTIVVPLKGRTEFTKRFLKFCQVSHCPFPVLLLDGGGQNDLAEEALKYELVKYYRCPYDKDMKTYVSKLAYGMSLVKTPYVVMASDDDFFDAAGFVEAVDWLQAHPGWVSFCGDVKSFTVSQDGKTIYPDKSIYTKPSVVGDTAKERIQNCYKHFHSYWHNITETTVLKVTFDLMKATALDDFKFVSMLQSGLTACFGKMKRNNLISFYYHQTNSPEIQGVDRINSSDWVLRDNWIENFNRMMRCVSASAPGHHHVFQDAFLDFLFDNQDAYHKFSDSRKELLKDKIKEAVEDKNLSSLSKLAAPAHERITEPTEFSTKMVQGDPFSADFFFDLQFYFNQVVKNA